MTDIRKYRFELNNLSINNKSFGIAFFDFIGTFIVAYIIYEVFDFKINKKIYYAMILPLAILIHKIFNVDTFLNKMILSTDVNIYKIILIIWIIWAFT